MITFDQVTVQYEDTAEPVLRDVNLTVEEGELCLVVGHTGVGKSTLLGAVNGLVPHFTGGTLYGRVTVDGRDTAEHPPRELADVVGVVGQDPLDGFVTDTVEEELAYAMEQLAVAPATMRKRVEETLDLLGLADLRHRALHELSGGQQQRVAIGSVLTAHPRVLVLDEPTSALDPTAAEEVLAAVTRLVHDLGVTVLLAEHRLERVVQYADRVIHLPGDGRVVSGPPAEVFRTSSIAPPVVDLGRIAGWSPLPLSIRDARRAAAPLRTRLDGVVPPPVRTALPADRPRLLSARGITVTYQGVPAVREVALDLRGGEITALMGRNGSGKSSLLWALQGSGPRKAGSVSVGESDGPGTRDPRKVSATEARRLVGLVPQTPTDLLYLESVKQELDQADSESAVQADGIPARTLLDRLAPGIPDTTHPRDLSEGQKLALVLAIQLAAAPRVVLLDEPTRGLDYRAKGELIGIVDGLAAEGRTVVISTHDVEFVARAADRVVVMAEGDVVADGPTTEVIVASPVFAPQTAKVLAPLPYLTVDQLASVLDAHGTDPSA
ncbi:MULTISPECIES: ABC transporter ATP-binding protein [Streptomyces]|uniref:ABC transporter ATP-binding protein n=1 Tax=Streptomyces griseus subsp. griseus (strain JCM 4626 / CBS 651.72 / NBRC 13350 / KCC S-0626 / ISP 5235) TaxID=455632 RepID=B1VXL4_STRGG|nr:ABC transporter ATP-binding protein [Streptomyces griseus]MBW3704123.1 ATP-binding cassette domain-containing protein [Streptomyces griseus]BAG18480.1 putative ABC transporter ATP-binding protein [Streptomyces griseus subsp. griseus NBRC 13350]SED48007.1 energy-coupling factor transport system ATP-binding protein [Streptomyces griseus]SQA25746.1 ABC transporter ATP-binding protein [Streptomyces griseus]